MRLFLTPALILLLCACSQEKATIAFETVSASKTVALSNDSVPPTCNVSIRLEQATAQSGRAGEIINATVANRLLNRNDDGLKQAAEAFAVDYTNNYVKTLLPLYNEDRDDVRKHAWYHYHYIVNSHTQPGSTGTVVYLTDINYCEGGSQASSQQVIMNFEIETGRLLTVQDIFVDGFETRLNPILLKALQTKTGFTTMKALHDNGYLKNSDIFVPENFILGSDAITFVYNPDEIAPSIVGCIELTVSFAAIENILSSMFEH